jgi:hypothetical protein
MTNEVRIEAIEQVMVELLGAIRDHDDTALWSRVLERLERVIEDGRDDDDPNAKEVTNAVISILSSAEGKGRKAA